MPGGHVSDASVVIPRRLFFLFDPRRFLKKKKTSPTLVSYFYHAFPNTASLFEVVRVCVCAFQTRRWVLGALKKKITLLVTRRKKKEDCVTGAQISRATGRQTNRRCLFPEGSSSHKKKNQTVPSYQSLLQGGLAVLQESFLSASC